MSHRMAQVKSIFAETMTENERKEKAVAIGELILEMFDSIKPMVTPEEDDMPLNVILNCTDTGKYLGISQPTLRTYTARGLLHLVSLGGKKGYNTSELKQFKQQWNLIKKTPRL